VKTFLVHGEDPARQALAERIRAQMGFAVVLPVQNQVEDLP